MQNTSSWFTACVVTSLAACSNLGPTPLPERSSGSPATALVANTEPFYGYWYADGFFGIHHPEVARFSSILHLNVAAFGHPNPPNPPPNPWTSDDANAFNHFAAHMDVVRNSYPHLKFVIDVSDLFCQIGDPYAQASKLGKLAEVLGPERLAFVQAMYVWDEPELAKPCAANGEAWSQAKLQDAITMVEGKFPGIPTMVTYLGAESTPIATTLDLIAFDNYPQDAGRVEFDNKILGALYRIKSQQRAQGLSQPIIIVGTSIYTPENELHDFNPLPHQWWYYEIWRQDPQLLGLWWFRHGDVAPPNQGAKQIPTMTSIHEQIWNEMKSRNLLLNGGFESGSSSWGIAGSPMIIDSREAGQNLVANPGFESLDGSGTPIAWQLFGHPPPSISFASHSGNNAALSTSQSRGFYQPFVPIPNAWYKLRQWMRGYSGGEQGRLQVNWYGANGSILSTSLLAPTLDTTYREYSMVVAAPAGAARAEVYATSHTDSDWVLIEDVHLSDLSDDQYLHGGARAAEVSATSPLYQRVSVTPGMRCTLWQFMRRGRGGSGGSRPSASQGRLQVNWLDSAGNTIGTSLPPSCLGNISPPEGGYNCIGSKTLTDEYEQGRLELEVPPNAALAEVYASSNESNGWMLVDDMTFVCR